MSAIPANDAPAKGADKARVGYGIALMVAGVGIFIVVDALIKWLGSRYPTFEVIFFRSLFAFIPLSFLFWRLGGYGKALTMRNKGGHLLRSLTGLVALFLFFHCYVVMPLADVIAISFAAPLFVTALSAPLLGEKVGPRRWGAVLVGLCGVLLMVRPGEGIFELTALLALLATFFYACTMLTVRWLSRTDNSVSIVFWFSLSMTLVSGATLPFLWITPTWLDLLALVTLGLLGGCAQVLVTEAFRHAELSVVAPFEYTSMFWAAGLGWLFWGELPDGFVWLGCAIVVASGLYILVRETNLGLRRGVGRRLQPRR